jgi:hypothetical protein
MAQSTDADTSNAQPIKIEDPSYFTKIEIAAYNAYAEHGSYAAAGRALGKDKTTVYRQVERFEEKLAEARDVGGQVVAHRVEQEIVE